MYLSFLQGIDEKKHFIIDVNSYESLIKQYLFMLLDICFIYDHEESGSKLEKVFIWFLIVVFTLSSRLLTNICSLSLFEGGSISITVSNLLHKALSIMSWWFVAHIIIHFMSDMSIFCRKTVTTLFNSHNSWLSSLFFK